MEIVVKVNSKSGASYIPSSLRRMGFAGEVKGHCTQLLLVLVRPGATIKEVRQSLILLSKDLELMRE